MNILRIHNEVQSIGSLISGLPPGLDEDIFSFLTLRDMVQFGQTNRAAAAHVWAKYTQNSNALFAIEADAIGAGLFSERMTTSDFRDWQNEPMNFGAYRRSITATDLKKTGRCTGHR